MNVIKSEQITFFDVDGTLILPLDGNEPRNGRRANVFDAVTKKYIQMAVHEPMVRLLEEEHRRGAIVIVWSRGGWEWAEAAIKALQLEDKVHIIMSKPMAYFDDTPIAEWLPYRVFLKPETIYKK